MAKSGLPNSWALLILMSEADFSPSTVDKVRERFAMEKTLEDRIPILNKLVELLENGISEADFLKELEK